MEETCSGLTRRLPGWFVSSRGLVGAAAMPLGTPGLAGAHPVGTRSMGAMGAPMGGGLGPGTSVGPMGQAAGPAGGLYDGGLLQMGVGNGNRPDWKGPPMTEKRVGSVDNKSDRRLK